MNARLYKVKDLCNNRYKTLQDFEEERKEVTQQMASCDWEKKKGAGEAKALFRHCDTKEREKANHSNKDIDKSLTHLNMSFGLYDNPNGYDAICKEYDDHIAYLDSKEGANKRKDRVTLCALNITVPKGMDDATAQLWCIEAYEVLYDCFGKNLLGATAHFDERHTYIDTETKKERMSRVHLQAQVIPDINGKLNAKALTSRSNMIILNNRIEEMTKSRFPGYKFMTGEKKKSRKTVEELKQASDVLAVTVEAQQEAAKIVEEARQRADKLDDEAVAKLEKAEKFSIEERRKASEDAENTRMNAKRKAEQIQKDAETSSEAILSNAKAEADKVTFKVQKRLREANTALQSAKEREAEAEQEKQLFKKKDEELEQAKLLYQNAFDDAKAIARGFAEDAFYQRFYNTFRDALTGLKYKDGSTAWDRFSKYADNAFEEAKKVTKYYNTSPNDAYRERVTERVQKAEHHVQVARQVPDMPYSQNESENDGYSL